MVRAVRRLGRVQRLALAAGAAASLALPGGAGAEPAISLRGSASVGGDTNPLRLFGPSQADAVGSALLDAAGRLALGPVDAGGSYEAAGRKFLHFTGADTLAQEAKAELGVRPLGTVQLVLDGRAKDRRGGPRVYSDLQSALALRWRAVPELEVELRGGAHRFIDWTEFEFGYSYSAPEAGAGVRFRFDRHHSLTVGGELGHRRYNALVYMPPPDPPEVVREDAVLTASAGYSYRGAFQLSAGYQYYDADSNSPGETVRLHRVDLTLGAPLPWSLLLFTQLTLQLADYPDGIYLSSKYILDPDDELHDALSFQLVRPLGDRVDLELRYGVYVDVLQKNEQTYFRQVVSVGLGARM